MQKFWYVSRDPSTVSYHDPKKAFFMKSQAKEFAEKMVKETGHDFYVMEAVELVRKTAPPIEWINISEPVGVKAKPITTNTTNRWFDYLAGRWRDANGRFVK